MCRQLVRFAIHYGIGIGVILLSICAIVGIALLGSTWRIRSRGDNLAAIGLIGLTGLVIVSTVVIVLVMYLGLSRNVIGG